MMSLMKMNEYVATQEKICEKNKTPDCSGVYLVAPSGIDPLT